MSPANPNRPSGSLTAKIDFAAAIVEQDEATKPYDDEGLFARDVDGQLVRLKKGTVDDFDTAVTLSIDGRSITVKRAVYQRDAQGTILRDAEGHAIPRPTTIYDAASEAFVHDLGDAHPIPTLCHKEHLPPVGVCRVCIVEAAEQSRRGIRKKLVPSCVQRVSEGMIVNTINSTADPEAASRVRDACRTVTELLVADHLPAAAQSAAAEAAGNELAALAHRLKITTSRFADLLTPESRSADAPNDSRGHDDSSFMIAIDHDQCIMCGRCERGCSFVKDNNVIGRMGKGYTSHIGFDLDDPMGHSTCVSCGECAISCPTGALEFKPSFVETQIARIRHDAAENRQQGTPVLAEELAQMPLFSGIPPKFLQFNSGAAFRRTLSPGDVLCREGEYGSTAFVLVRGRFEIFLSTTRGAVRNQQASGIADWVGALKTTVATKIGGLTRLGDLSGTRLAEGELAEGERIFRGPEDVILGEMTCLNGYPRSATVVAVEDSEVIEIRRNVLYMLQRNTTSRKILDRVYRSRSLRGRLATLPIFADVSEEAKNLAAEFLKDRADLITVDPGQTIFRQGERADAVYINRLGFVKVTQKYGRSDRVINYIAPGNYFGEVGLLTDTDSGIDAAGGGGRRTATCSALDHVELIRIRGSDFRHLLRELPELAEPLMAAAMRTLKRDRVARERLDAPGTEDFIDQGLFLAQSLLVLDLEKCTRCDECTKACADTHGGVTRLVREGLRFDRFLIASSCRSCMDPYCLVGCPVDAIHRDGDSLEIAIEDYCIGCGLCADNCPYGNINMHGVPKMEIDVATGRERRVYQISDTGKKLPVVQQRATTCDLCRSVDGRPSCVYACPHDAAHRMSGEQLLQIVEKNGHATFG